MGWGRAESYKMEPIRLREGNGTGVLVCVAPGSLGS